MHKNNILYIYIFGPCGYTFKNAGRTERLRNMPSHRKNKGLKAGVFDRESQQLSQRLRQD